MPDEIIVPNGTRVTYWGRVAGYYGTEMTVLWANQCNCKHQTYCLEASDGKRLEKVLRSSFHTMTEDQDGHA